MGYNLFPLKFFSNFLGRATTSEDFLSKMYRIIDVGWRGEGERGCIDDVRSVEFARIALVLHRNHSVIKIHFADSSGYTPHTRNTLPVSEDSYLFGEKLRFLEEFPSFRIHLRLSLPLLPSFLDNSTN